ncbi:hypothetical protein TNCT_330891 [Trichonephila clavata]|uniref:Uncharacterized protein n=1 Tax=Trichonephila clavata TaxID=2740835 RepID=A0A8X6LM76_TRICU|nr:hypothetical protein TNCT_330891 [Trichonephila clavata]
MRMVTSLKVSHAAHTLMYAKSWDCWKMILISTRQWKRRLCLSHQDNSVTSLPFWLPVCGLNKPITLWENHKKDMTDDFLHQERRNNPIENIEYCDALVNNTLLILEDKILYITGHKLALYGLPEPVHDQPELTSIEGN